MCVKSSSSVMVGAEATFSDTSLALGSLYPLYSLSGSHPNNEMILADENGFQ